MSDNDRVRPENAPQENRTLSPEEHSAESVPPSEEEATLRKWLAQYGPGVVTGSVHMNKDRLFVRTTQHVARSARWKIKSPPHQNPDKA